MVVFEYALTAAPGLWFTPSATLATVPWAAVSRWLGPHGATFVVALVASTIAVGFLRPRETLRAAIPLLVAAVLIAGAVTSTPHALPDHVRVAAVVTRVPADVDRCWRDGEARTASP